MPIVFICKEGIQFSEKKLIWFYQNCMTFMKSNRRWWWQQLWKCWGGLSCNRGITGGLAIVKTDDDYAYYLIKCTCDPFATDSETKDYYNHTYPPEHKIVVGNYLDTQRH